ncbi:MAG: hypothetical protein KDN22_31230 [Verrucomicrobiae bacterium]|nr:hypothetical protein [Verrucomicrobiae bacterium]
MPRLEDPKHLLRKFVDHHDEAAFRDLVTALTPLVYGVAKRRLSDAQQIEEVCQNVFVALAGKAAALIDHPSPSAWVHRTAALETLKAVRTAATKQRRLAMIENELSTRQHSCEDWTAIRPLAG